MFELVPDTQGSTLTLLLKGDLLFEEIVAFNDKLREYSKTPKITHLVLDLAEVRQMDKAGLGALVSLNTSMQRYGRKLVLLHPSPYFQGLLLEAEIEGFFPVCESLEELKGFIPENKLKGRDSDKR
ncbi:MAG: STAS domain-containing protein [Desulfovibrio sp.]|nr:STAS domain-containing protein [Desulfovibrio sp.]